jgi:hypothetical protein
MRATAGLNADDALGSERFMPYQELSVLFGVDVVRDDTDLVAISQRSAEQERERCLARSHRAADTDA